MPDRRYSEEEFAELLRAASEIQSRALVRSDSGSAREGMTLEEITSIAQEVGLSAESIQQASALFPAEQEGTTPTASRFAFRGSFPGTLNDELKLRLLQAARDSSGAAGEVEQHPTGIEWRAMVDAVDGWELAVHHVGGQNEWRLSVGRKDAKALIYMGSVLLAFALSILVAGPGLGLGKLAALGAGAVGGGTLGGGVGRIWDRRSGGKVQQKASALAKEVARLLATAPQEEDDTGA